MERDKKLVGYRVRHCPTDESLVNLIKETNSPDFYIQYEGYLWEHRWNPNEIVRDYWQETANVTRLRYLLIPFHFAGKDLFSAWREVVN